MPKHPLLGAWSHKLLKDTVRLDRNDESPGRCGNRMPLGAV